MSSPCPMCLAIAQHGNPAVAFNLGVTIGMSAEPEELAHILKGFCETHRMLFFEYLDRRIAQIAKDNNVLSELETLPKIKIGSDPGENN